ncbi:hypothetical protein [Candidatus Palauibacter irciniicola]|uniref:hypothetical protein n=1 Tax=Candidatus Palauibacter irciniicola TaxID=3056733 RepID=UPI003B018B6A
MLGSPQVIAIDDREDHLAGLANCLNQNGVACLQIHFSEDHTGIHACPDVRIIFADLHLVPGTASDHTADFAVIGGLLENTIRPTGPYYVVLWTQYPEQAPALHEFLDERLGGGVTKPFDVCPLPKSDHIDQDGNIADEPLMEAIYSIVRGLPQVGALFDWEGQVLGAAGRTVSSILALASQGDGDGRADRLGRILGRLAVEAVGREHVERDRFRAINDALLPILADRVAEMGMEALDQQLWDEALTMPETAVMSSVERAARLNRLVHIADPDGISATERGAVVLLPESYRDGFQDYFGLAEPQAAEKQFRCKDLTREDSRFRWVLVQCQAACDHAQSNPGTLPYYLGLDFPEANRSGTKPRDSTWRGPVFEFEGEIRRLRVNAGSSLSLPPSAMRDAKPLYRLREQMLNDLAYHLHTHGARPGLISFGRR